MEANDFQLALKYVRGFACLASQEPHVFSGSAGRPWRGDAL